MEVLNTCLAHAECLQVDLEWQKVYKHFLMGHGVLKGCEICRSSSPGLISSF